MSERTVPTLEQIAALADTGSAYGIVNIVAELAAVLIVHNRRLDALEQQARPYQEDGELAVGEASDARYRDDLIDLHARNNENLMRAEAAERELARLRETYEGVCLGQRNALDKACAARATVERLRDALRDILANERTETLHRIAAAALKETP